MKDQAAKAQSILNRIKETRERIDTARTGEVLRDCDLKGIREEVVELEVQTTEINCKLFLQYGGGTSTEEMKEVERALQGDFRRVTQGLHSLERAMSDNWEKLLQLSVPKGSHGASSTGLFEEADTDGSFLDLGSKSPPPKPLLDKTGAADVTGSGPNPPSNSDLFGEGPRQQASMTLKIALIAV